MERITYSFSKALLAYTERIPTTDIAKTPGDRYLFNVVLARLYVANLNGKGIPISKMMLDAESLGLSGRTATRLIHTLIERGLVTDGHGIGRQRILRCSPALCALWEKHIALFTKDLRKSGYFDLDKLAIAAVALREASFLTYII